MGVQLTDKSDTFSPLRRNHFHLRTRFLLLESPLSSLSSSVSRSQTFQEQSQQHSRSTLSRSLCSNLSSSLSSSLSNILEVLSAAVYAAISAAVLFPCGKNSLRSAHYVRQVIRSELRSVSEAHRCI